MSTNPKELFTDSLRFNAANFVSTELTAPITQAQEVFEVKDASQWPTLSDGEFFLAVIVSADDNSKKEVVKVVDIDGSSWTVERAFEDGTSFAFPAQSSVENRLTAGTIGYFRGMTLKSIEGANVSANPFCEYLSNGGQTFDLISDNFEEGQRARIVMTSTSGGTSSAVTVDGAPFTTVSGAGAYTECTAIGGVFSVTASGVHPSKNYSVMSGDFAAEPNMDYFVDMSDDVDKNVTVSTDVLLDGDEFRIHMLDPTDTQGVVVNLLFEAGTYAPDLSATEVFIEAATNGSYRVKNVDGKFRIVEGVGESYDGAYVMQRLAEVEGQVAQNSTLYGRNIPTKLTEGLAARRMGNVVTLNLSAGNTVVDFVGGEVFSTIPEGYRPVAQVGAFPVLLQQSGSSTFNRMTLETGGTLQINLNTTGVNFAAIDLAYITDDPYPVGDEL